MLKTLIVDNIIKELNILSWIKNESYFIKDNLNQIKYKYVYINFWKRFTNEQKNIKWWFLKAIEKMDIDLFALNNKNLLWWVIQHNTLTTKKNWRPAVIRFDKISSIKYKYKQHIAWNKFYWVLLWAMMVWKWETLKKNEKKLEFGLKWLLSIKPFYVKYNNMYILSEDKDWLQNFIYLLWLNSVVNITPVKIRNWFLEKTKEILWQIFNEKEDKNVFVRWTFLNPKSNQKDVSNMIELPNDVLQNFLIKRWYKYDDRYIRKILIDDIISTKKIEGFFLNYWLIK